MTVMIFHDSFMLLTSIVLFLSTCWFFYLTIIGLRRHSGDTITQQHFLEHCSATGFVAVGSLFLLVNDFQHLFDMNQDAIIEYPITIPELLLRLGVLLFLLHMIKEQTPGHPFYVREYQEEYSAVSTSYTSVTKNYTSD